ncbi:MAG: hypothetical protein Q8J68_14775 [Methanolobus sp.]|uniref:hypothetical protein n=1 Tax=Methanolobus sp. TaxID=1874737 RepID=UPI00272F08C9|nr:hypothetical protein [Methanolobus sp.]MDP2218539.1 hypothetical protein [Methanolobus sp.]
MNEIRQTAEQKEQERKWRIESDVKSLREAEEVKKDLGRMKDVEDFIKQEVAMLSKMDKMFPSMAKKEKSA